MAVNRATGKDLLTVSGSYDLDHLDYVFTNPERVFRVTHFFIDHWLPLLGPSLAWLVVAMQQACWRNGTRHPSGQVSQRQLGQFCGLKRETVNRHLNNPQNLVNWFLSTVDPVHDSKGGRTSNRYHVYLNDPLPPRIILGLRALLDSQELPQSDNVPTPKTLEFLVNHLTSLEQTALLQLFEDQPSTQVIDAEPTTVRALFYQYLHLDPQATNRRVNTLATNLSRRILQPDHVYIGTQYFREQWVPLLDATKAWFVTVVRRHCYENKADAESRDQFSFDKKTMAAKLGVSTKTLQRTLSELETLQPFFQSLEITHHGLSGRILVNDEPLTPFDQLKKDKVEQQLSQTEREASTAKIKLVKSMANPEPSTDPYKLSGQNITGSQNQSRQNITRVENQSGQIITGVEFESGQNVTGTQKTKEPEYHRGSLESGQNITDPDMLNRQNVTRSSAQSRQNITDSKHHLNSTQQYSAPMSTGVDEEAILNQLDQLTIRPPTREALARLPHLQEEGYLTKWVEWFRQQDQFGPGWVVQQIRAGLLPPEEPALTSLIPPTTWPTNLSDEDSSSEERLWQETLTVLRHQMTKGTFDAWLKDSRFASRTDETLVISVKSDQARIWLEHRLKSVIERAVLQVWDEPLSILFQVN